MTVGQTNRKFCMNCARACVCVCVCVCVCGVTAVSGNQVTGICQETVRETERPGAKDVAFGLTWNSRL